MTKRVMRSEIVDYVTWGEQKPSVMPEILATKRVRRIHVGDVLTFLFENCDTVRYQIQEMIRVERIVREADIVHEIKTYNELLGDAGGLGCVLLVEIPNEAERAVKLTRWLDLPQTLYAEVDGGERIRPTIDDRQVGETRLSSVQYLKFDLGGRTPVAIGCEHPDLQARTVLNEAQQAALEADLA